ncbi:MAG: SRPBCC family protein [Candidatus Limnocylindria bacterium]
MPVPQTERSSFEVGAERVAQCKPEELIRHLLDASRWPTWQPEIVATVGPERVRVGDVVRGHADLLGFGVAGQALIEEVHARGLVEDVLVGVRMRVIYEVEPRKDDCLVRARIVTEAPTGLSGRVLGFLLRRRLRRMQKKALIRLAQLAEAEAGAGIIDS